MYFPILTRRAPRKETGYDYTRALLETMMSSACYSLQVAYSVHLSRVPYIML